MDALNDGSTSAADLTLANEVRMYKRVVTIADLVTIDGKTITADHCTDISNCHHFGNLDRLPRNVGKPEQRPT